MMAMDCEMVETTEATDALGESVFSVAKESLTYGKFFTLTGDGQLVGGSIYVQIGDSHLHLNMKAFTLIPDT